MDTFELDAPDLVADFYADAPAGRGGSGGMAFAYNLVQQTDKTIAKNNRLALMIEIHGKRQARLAAQPVPNEMEVPPMAVKKVGNCDVCDRTKTTVVSVYNKKMCLPCSNAYSAVNVRPEIVVEAIKELNMVDKFASLFGAEQVPVHVESSALKAIAEIVGYQGTDGDQLLEAVRTFGLQEAPELPLDLIRALDCTADDWEMAAIHTAALLEQAIGQHIQDCTTIQRQAYDLGGLAQGADRMSEQIETLRSELTRIKDEYSMTTDRLVELEQQQVVYEQIFARLREIPGNDHLDNSEIPTAVARLVKDICFVDQLAQPDPVVTGRRQSSLDSHLLDLLLEFPAIGVERIAVIREAA